MCAQNTPTMEFQTRSLHRQSSDKDINRQIKDVARKLHKMKRRILQDIENEGGNPQNNWRTGRDESMPSTPPGDYVSHFVTSE